mgnify:CR=1 FL=1
MKINKAEIKKYFSDKTNIAIFIILLLVFAYATVVRFKNIGVLAYWGDDGQTFLGTLGILKHGIPRLPSGNIMYHSFFHFYLKVIPSYIFGLNEVALRFPSAFLGILTIPLIFLFVKDLLNKYAGILAAVITSFNIWQIEYSREIRYYQEFQFFYLLSVYLFYRGFFKDEKVSKFLSIFFILLTTLINNLGFTLIFLFIPLLVYKRFKKFFKTDIIVSFFLVLIIIGGEIVHRELFWKAGLSFYNTNITADITNPVLRILSKYFAPYVPFYNRIFIILFPAMSFFVFYGWPLIAAYIFIPQIRNPDEDFLSIFKKNDYSIKLPFNIFFLYFIFFSNTIFNGFGFQSTQQRYIYHIHPFFIAIFCYFVTDIARLVSEATKLILNQILKISKLKKSETCKKNMNLRGYPGFASYIDNKPAEISITVNNSLTNLKSRKSKYLKNSVYFAAIFLIFLSTVNWINPASNFKIIYRKNGDAVDSRFSVSNTFEFHHDPKTAGLYIYNNKGKEDVVIATDLLNPYGYTRQIDYWLWTSTTFTTWQPFVYSGWGVYEEFFGVPVIRDYYQFLKVLNENADKNIWLITSNSLRVPAHISRDVTDFILKQEQYKVVTGQDGICSAYLFPKTNNKTRGFELQISDENIIKIPENIGPDKPQKLFPFSFSNKKNRQYLVYGWSEMESQGTWADKSYAVLFLNFPEKRDYEIMLEVMPLYSAEKPQQLKVIINGIEIGLIDFNNNNLGQYTFFINKDLINTDSYNLLEFDSKFMLVPKDLKILPDTRSLSVFFSRITFSPK